MYVQQIINFIELLDAQSLVIVCLLGHSFSVSFMFGRSFVRCVTVCLFSHLFGVSCIWLVIYFITVREDDIWVPKVDMDTV